jgi:uroporphyrin-3 C-methyltransferase
MRRPRWRDAERLRAARARCCYDPRIDFADVAMSDPAAAPVDAAPTAAPRRAPAAPLPLLAAAVALVLGGWSAWTAFDVRRGLDAADAARATQGEALARAERNLADAQAARESLERRLKDAEGVNQSLREEVLGLGERARLLEDAVSRLAERGLSGAVLLRLNEAEFLLRMGAERLALFDDPDATIAAFRLADAELAALDDPLFAGVRQTLAAEVEALAAVPRADRADLLRRLDAVVDALPGLPARGGAAAVEATPLPSTAGWLDQAAAALSRYVRVRELPADAAGAVVPDAIAGRAAVAVDLSLAKAALATGDDAALRAAAGRARARIEAGFATDDPGVQQALSALDAVLAAPVAAGWPEVGRALAELRNLRATRALATGAASGSP